MDLLQLTPFTTPPPPPPETLPAIWTPLDVIDVAIHVKGTLRVLLAAYSLNKEINQISKFISIFYLIFNYFKTII